MSQDEQVGPVSESVGYVLKQAAVALRTAMDSALRPLDLTVSQYSCLEILGQQPGLSNAELARAVFVSRQSMNLVLRGLQDRDLVSRPDHADQGRSRPTVLTPAGLALVRAASTTVRDVERQLFSALTAAEQVRLRENLAVVARSGPPTD